MAKTTQIKTIDSIEYSIDQLGGMKGLRLFNRLLRLCAPALGSIGKALADRKSLADMDLDSVGKAVSAMLVSLTDDDLESLTRELLGSCTFDREGKRIELMSPGVFDLEMRGKVGTILKLLSFALEVNYGNFFEALQNAGAGQ